MNVFLPNVPVAATTAAPTAGSMTVPAGLALSKGYPQFLNKVESFGFQT